MDGEDPFAFVVKQCIYSKSQEDILDAKPISVDSQGSIDSPIFGDTPGKPGIQVESTGIIICSLPDSASKEEDEYLHEEFQTPPEDSLLATSDDRSINDGHHVVADGGDRHETEAVAIASNLGLSSAADKYLLVSTIEGEKSRVVKRDLPLDEDVFVLHSSPSKRPLPGSKILGLEQFSDVAGESRDFPEETAESHLEDNSHSNPATESNENIQIHDSMLVIQNSTQEEKVQVETDKYVIEVSGIGSPAVDPKCGTEVTQSENGDSGGFQSDRNSTINGKVGRRKLPLSICRLVVNPEGDAESALKSARAKLVMGLIEVLGMLSKEASGNDEEVDILELAKGHGMAFPRPRWWPPNYK